MSRGKKKPGPWIRTDEELGGKPIVVITSEGRGRWVTGEGGGRLFFAVDGSVKVFWNRAAAIAADHGKGRRSVRMTKATGNRAPARITKAMDYATFWRAIGRKAEAVGDPFPDHGDPATMPEKVTPGMRAAAWELMSAVLRGDHKALSEIAGALEFADRIETGEEELQTRRWQQVADAIAIAAEDCADVPNRRAVAEILRPIRVREQGTVDLRDELARMGFGWLPSPSGRPRKKVD